MGRIDQIAQHHRDMVAPAGLFRDRYGLHRRNRGSGRWLGHQRYRLWRGIKLGDRTQHFATITKNDAEVFEVLIGQVREDREINPVLREALSVLGHTEIFEPVRNVLHRLPPRRLHRECKLSNKFPWRYSEAENRCSIELLPGISAFFYQRQHLFSAARDHREHRGPARIAREDDIDAPDLKAPM